MNTSQSSNTNDSEERAYYNPDYFEPLFLTERKHFWFRVRNKAIYTLVEKATRSYHAKYSVLELGCGTGNVLEGLVSQCQGGLVIGADLFIEGLMYARRRVSSPLVQADMFALPFSVPFDLIGAFDVLEHLPDDEQILAHLLSLLNPGGYLLLTVPAFPSLWSYFDEAACHVQRYTLQGMQSKLLQAGFEVEYISYYMMSAFLPVWIARKLSGLLKKGPLSESEQDAKVRNDLKVIPVFNDIMGFVLSTEVRLMKWGAHFPFGTSLIVLARRKVL